MTEKKLNELKLDPTTIEYWNDLLERVTQYGEDVTALRTQLEATIVQESNRKNNENTRSS